MRFLATASIGAALIAVVGCGNNPTAPTPTPIPTPVTVSAVTVTTGSTLASVFQMTATARLSDGSTQDVTRTATWESSNAQVATVSAGAVTVVGSGELDIRATYQSVSGSMHVLVGRVPPVSVSISGLSTAKTFQQPAELYSGIKPVSCLSRHFPN